MKINKMAYPVTTRPAICPLAIFLLCMLLPGRTDAQYYPVPERVEASALPMLEAAVRQDTGMDRFLSIMRLSALYYSKPVRTGEDLDSALHYALLATTLAGQRSDRTDAAGFLLGSVYLAQNKHELAGRLLPGLSDTTREKLLLALSMCYIYRDSGPADSNALMGQVYAREAKATALRYRQAMVAAQADLCVAEADIALARYTVAATELNTLLKTYREQGYKGIQYVYYQLSDLADHTDDDGAELQNILKAISAAKASSDSVVLGDLTIELGEYYKNRSSKDTALTYFKMAYAIYLRYRGFSDIYLAIERIAETLIDQHKYNEALAFAQSSIAQYPSGSFFDKQKVLSLLADCYLRLKQYGPAEKYFLQEYNFYVANNAVTERTYHRMAFFYIESHQYSKALPYLDKAASLARKMPLGIQAHLQYMYYLADSAGRNFEEAMHHLSRNRALDDTIVHAARVASLQKIAAQYETEKKNQAIDALSKQQRIQVAELREARLTRGLAVFGLIVLLLLGGVFYNQYRHKQRNAGVIFNKNQQLEKLVSEKEWLLKEVHHRVKNNLHTIICLLQIQAEYLKDDALKAIENSQHRIYSMSLIHQKLYLTDHKDEIDVASYVPELILYLRRSFGDPTYINFQTTVESVSVNVSVAVTLGLIINEAVSNSIKYAFVEKTDNCVIGVGVQSLGKEVILNISDNGGGLPQGGETVKESSLGLKLIRGLCADIKAHCSIRSNNGTHITIRFAPEVLADV